MSKADKDLEELKRFEKRIEVINSQIQVCTNWVKDLVNEVKIEGERMESNMRYKKMEPIMSSVKEELYRVHRDLHNSWADLVYVANVADDEKQKLEKDIKTVVTHEKPQRKRIRMGVTVIPPQDKNISFDFKRFCPDNDFGVFKMITKPPTTPPPLLDLDELSKTDTESEHDGPKLVGGFKF